MHRVKSVGVMSFAKIMGMVYGCMGLLFVPFFLIVGLAGSFAGGNRVAFPFAGAVGVVFALLAPLLYGAMGFVFGAIGALLYNLIANWVGGFEIELTPQPAGLVAPYPIVPPPTPGI
jgi:hypothetical protein